MTEAYITARVVKELRARGIRCRKIWQGAYSLSGTSDVIGTIPPTGRALYIEMKTPGAYAKADHSLTALQKAFLDDMREAGAIAFCACSWEQVRVTLGLS